jgi:prevent-host-death family protein
VRPRRGERQGCEGLRRANRKPVSAHQAKAQFSALLDRVEHKKRLVITRRNRPIGDLQAAFDGQTA